MNILKIFYITIFILIDKILFINPYEIELEHKINQNNKQNDFFLRMKVGTPPQFFECLIKITFPGLALVDIVSIKNSNVYKFNKYKSSSLNLIKKYAFYKNSISEIFGSIVNDKVSIGGRTDSVNLTMLLVNNENKMDSECVLGFGSMKDIKIKSIKAEEIDLTSEKSKYLKIKLAEEDKNNNKCMINENEIDENLKTTDYIELLYRNRIIPNKLFTIEVKTDKKIIIGLGEYSKGVNEYKNQNKNFQSCYFNKSGCLLEKINLINMNRDLSFKHTEQIINFDINSNEIIFSYDIFYELVENLKDICILKNDEQYYSYLLCYRSNKEKLHRITVYFDSNNYIVIDPEDYIIDTNYKYLDYFELSFRTYHVNNNYNCLGRLIIRKYFFIFDKEEKKVSWGLNPQYEKTKN